MTPAARHATVKPCQFCGFPFDQEAAGGTAARIARAPVLTASAITE